MKGKFRIVALLRLCSIPKIGSQRIRKLIARFETPEAALTAATQELVAVPGIDRTLAGLVQKGGDSEFAASQINLMEKAGTELISYWDVDYPELLKRIADPPILFFLRGSRDALKRQSIAIVGTRIPSTYGKLMTEKLTGELVGNNLTIVSGLARGIDTIAHNTVVQMGGSTIAVLGSGVDVIYPDENKSLAQKICGDGAVISEFYMGAKPDAPHFPRRNRIISGLSLGTVVVEAGEKSGALITADCALDQNREVFALPGNANNPRGYGSNRLIQQGAKLVLTVNDILEEIEGQLDLFSNAEKKQRPKLSGLDEIIYNLLSVSDSKHIDKIASESQKSIAQVLSALLSLELQGVVKQLVGKNFIRSY
jgi:DNA processing protein